LEPVTPVRIWPGLLLPFNGERMSVKCTIEIEFRNNGDAVSVQKAIELDNGQYARAHVNGNVLELQADAKSMPSMLHTLEDLLACIKVADGVVNLR
jgi:hypothetical protein